MLIPHDLRFFRSPVWQSRGGLVRIGLMTTLNLSDQLRQLIRVVGQAIAQLDDASTLKSWFANELETLGATSAGRSMEELSARMRAIRQLEFLVRAHADPQVDAHDPEASVYTKTARNPASHFDLVKQSNFSIESPLLMGARAVNLFDLVSPTAKLVGYLRSLGDASAFGESLSCPTQARAILKQLGILDDAIHAQLSLLFRSRYFAINDAIAAAGVRQILEIASGISPRGLQWSRRQPGTVYIESDLPALMREKAKVLRTAIFEDGGDNRGVLHCCGLDALNLASIRHALAYTDPDAKLVILTEGLLLYFNEHELRQFLQHLRTILTERRNAVWVADLVSKQNLSELCSSDANLAAAVKAIFASTQRAVISENPLTDDDSIAAILGEHGLQVTSQLPLSLIGQRLLDVAGDSRLDAARICGTRKIWTIAAQ